MKTSDEPDLVQRVKELSYDDLVEAANFFFPESVGTADTRTLEEKLAAEVEQRGGDYSVLEELLNAVGEDEESVDFLLRSVLLRAAMGTGEERARLEEAIGGVGRSQVVVELVYAIFAATALGIVWLAEPPEVRITRTTVVTHPDGTTVETSETSIEEIPPPVDKLFGWIKDLWPGKGQDQGGRPDGA
jgi:hypothetical protein